MATSIDAVITEVYAIPTTAPARIYGPIKAGEEHSLQIRVANLSKTAADVIDIKTQRGATVTGVRCDNQNLEPSNGLDIDGTLTLNAGAELWARSGGGNVAVSITGTFRRV